MLRGQTRLAGGRPMSSRTTTELTTETAKVIYPSPPSTRHLVAEDKHNLVTE